MPPQGVALAGALVWNYSRSKRGKVTLSQATRRHKVAFVIGWSALSLWILPHIVLEGS
jgi:hypothetical protein